LGTSAIEGMAWGVVLGGILQLAWQLPSMSRAGFFYRPLIDWRDPGLRRVVLLMGPAVVGNAAVQINVMVNTNLATYVVDPLRGPNGPVSWLGWAFRFMQLPLGVFGVALGSATLPAVSRSLATGDLDEFRRTLSRSLGVVFLLTVPSSVGLIVLGKHMIAAVYQSGKVNTYDTAQTALALSCYAVGLAGYAGIKILAPAFYAMHDSRIPMLVSLASIGVNLAAATLSLRYTELGHAGLALATSVVALFSFVSLFSFLRNRASGIYGKALASSTLRIVLASGGMGALIAALESVMDGRFGTGRMGALATLGVCIPAGFLFYGMVCRLLRLPEWDLAANAVLRPLRRVSGWGRDRIG
jgi:putative peptidoglycan lipid II flippase